MTAHLLYPTVLTFRRISDRHDVRPRTVEVANENSLPGGGASPAAEPIGSPGGPGAASQQRAAPVSVPVQSSFHDTGDNRA